jgi:hypothetical protein
LSPLSLRVKDCVPEGMAVVMTASFSKRYSPGVGKLSTSKPAAATAAENPAAAHAKIVVGSAKASCRHIVVCIFDLSL